jgi:MoxR-like ATPase
MSFTRSPPPGKSSLPTPARRTTLDSKALFYTGRMEQERRTDPLPHPVRDALDIPSLYEPDEALIAAVNVALTLRMPLLLTGKPGTGKSELARSLTLSLHGQSTGRLFEVTVNSAADKSDLLYRYDELGRLRDAYSRENMSHADRDYMRLRGLGAAIVAAGKPDDPLTPIVPGRQLPDHLATLADLIGAPPAIAAQSSDADPRRAFFLPPHAAPPVVLIDEIDKAPRELPNDLLIELDRMRFDIPELGIRVSLADPQRWPVVVITSNAERPLSDAFLRRCICFEVEVPSQAKLTSIVGTKLRALEVLDDKSTLPADVSGFVERLRISREIPENEQPGTARVLDFAVLIGDPARFGGTSLRDLPEPLLRAALTALMPSRAAQERARKVWDEWRKSPLA